MCFCNKMECSVIDFNDLSFKNCIVSVVGMPSSSSSPSDTWIINLKKGTTYKGLKIDTLFAKIWLDSTSILDVGYRHRFFDALDYEISMYKNIISERVHDQNFIKYIGDAKSYTFDDLLDILDRNDGKRDEKMASLSRNIDLISKFSKERPSISTKSDKVYEVDKNNRYNVLMLEHVSKGSVTLGEFIERKGLDWSIIFQILIACREMNSVDVTHNDLHRDNVFVTPIKERVIT